MRRNNRQDGLRLALQALQILYHSDGPMELPPHLLELLGKRFHNPRHRRDHNVLPIAADRLHRPVHRAADQNAVRRQTGADLRAAEHTRSLVDALCGLWRRDGIDKAELVVDEAVVVDRKTDGNA